MNIESVKSIFAMFSGEECSEKYAPVVSLAFSEVQRMLLPDSDPQDIRLEFLCAAIANYRVQQIKSASDRTEITYAGKIISELKGSPLSFAENLVRDYYRLCRDLINPQSFVFIGFSSKEDL